jgi:prepilin-type N-terminal cleavage/methylation domain-containing protein/prepilin-type processing-associated H-X9-DG protein
MAILDPKIGKGLILREGQATAGIPAMGDLLAGCVSRARRAAAFTLIELLVVISIVALLAALMLPALARAKHLGAEKVCASNLRQVNLTLMMYADDHDALYPLEPTEHNPHTNLVTTLDRYQGGVLRACYCPRARFLERFASDPSFVPVGDHDSVIDTAENRERAHISYVYWSFVTNKYCAAAEGDFNRKHWRNPNFFIPRQLTTTGVVWIHEDRPKPEGDLSQRWVMTDFFRRGAPFPHARRHARGLNVVCLDGHVELIQGRPRDNYR